jgi:RNA ligase
LKLTELFTIEALELEVREGYVKVQAHPTLPLNILNYTDKATYDRRWNDVTMHCRGLIVNTVTDDVVARGPRKFFNYGEPSAKSYPLDTQVRLTRKEDGSLGIGWLYQESEEEGEECFYGIATRGSFTSEQAVHASDLVEQQSGHNGKYELLFEALDQYRTNEVSYIGEIVYPENRIVLDYAGRDEVIGLGTVDNKSGLILWRPLSTLVEGKPAILTLGEALALPIPDDEEGYVLDILDEYLNVVDHIKLKGDRYKELHAAIFGLSERAVWEQCAAGTAYEFCQALPDEVQPWAEEVTNRLWRQHDKLWFRIIHAHAALFAVLGIGFTRKDAALYLKRNYPDVMSPVFNLLDGKEERRTEWIWKQIKPDHVPFSATKTLESVN